ncbi:MAG: hypothetical protein H6817_02270 [Phycisphaerales bacterium]|nr:hypothetical protein [Phycisphaerales bacterium]
MLDDQAPRWQRWLTHRRLPFALALLVVVLTLPALRVGLEADDYFHRIHLLADDNFPNLTGPAWDLFAFSYGDAERVHALMDRGIAPWWTLPNLKMAFCRPLSSLTHALDYVLWPDSPWLMHAQNLVWFSLFVAGAAVVYRRIMGPTLVAGIAALLFALDDAHATPAGWIAGRNTLVAATFGVWCLAAHDRWRRDGWRAGAFVAPSLFLLALLSAEAGVATLAYIVPHALLIEPGRVIKRLRGLAPYFVLLVIWRIAWSLHGYGVYGVGAYVDPVGSPLQFAKSVCEVAPILLLAQWALPPSDPYTFYDALLPGLAVIVWSVALVFLALAAWIMYPPLRCASTARFWALGMAFALLPICATADFPMDRLLLFVGLGAFGLLACFLDGVRRSRGMLATVPPLLRRGSKVLAIFFLIVHLIIAPISLVARAAAPAGPKNFTKQFYIELPDDPSLAERDVVVVNAPSGGLVGMFPIMQAVDGKPIPRRMRMLGPSLSAITIERLDERTLLITPDDGFMAWSYDHLVRSLDHPFAPGDVIKVTGMTVEVTATTDDGRPATAKFTFDVPLDDASLLWLQWRDGAFVDFPLPAVGEIVKLPRANPQM